MSVRRCVAVAGCVPLCILPDLRRITFKGARYVLYRLTFSRLLKNARLLRYAHHLSLRRTKKYASFLMISCALQSDIFDQPLEKGSFNR